MIFKQSFSEVNWQQKLLDFFAFFIKTIQLSQNKSNVNCSTRMAKYLIVLTFFNGFVLIKDIKFDLVFFFAIFVFLRYFYCQIKTNKNLW